MKIDIITLHAVKNYGSVLQALATQELFRQVGFEPRIINFVKEESKKENLMKFWAGNNVLKKIAIFPTLMRWEVVFDKFCKDNLNLTEKQYTTENDFIDFSCDADVYCTGSDQVWNSVWNNGIILPLYLSFVPNDKYKVAFSASFGQTQLSDEEVEATRHLISEYDMISVRERSAQTILQKQYGYTGAVHLLDPTLCMSPDFWRNYSTRRKIPHDYIVIYNLNRSKDFDDYAVQLSKKTGLKLYRICTRYDQFYRPGNSILVPSVYDFISLIDSAKYVLTDSFHATAFSLNMNTEPICVLPPKFGDRIISFLELTKSGQRIIKDYDDIDVVNRNVDFGTVNTILEVERKKSFDFAKKVYENASNIIGENMHRESRL